MERFQVAIVGSGFAGTILARILHRQGVRVVLLERGRHPRFAIGESSTPLGALCLERLARDYDLPDLRQLAAYGRWMEAMPEVQRGLKRGFTFYRHHPGQELRDSPQNSERLLVAASPDDAVADTHWLRSDVDHHLVRLAMDEGVEYRDRTEIRRVVRSEEGGWTLSGVSSDSSCELQVENIVDGSGAGGFLSWSLPIESALGEVELDTALVYGHFTDLGSFPELHPGPYPDAQAAVHHLLDEGWMYVLPFDDGVVSAGILLRREAMRALSAAGIVAAEDVWREVLGRYPTLADQFAAATAVRPLAIMPRVQRRLAAAAGERWALLPHAYTFLDPMFSTGIAWSLLAVERLAGLFTASRRAEAADAERLAAGLERYGQQLAVEAQQMATLLDGAYLAAVDFPLFVSQSFLYFATVSYEEVDQRLFPDGRGGTEPAWRGFLGAGDPRSESLFVEAKRRLADILVDRRGEPRRQEREDFAAWVVDKLADRNLCGFGDPARRNLYPVDLELLVERADLLGLTPVEMRSLLPRLRGV